MKRVILNIQDNLYDPIINLLEQLGKEKVEIVSSEIIHAHESKNLKIEIKKILKSLTVQAFKKIEDPVKWQREQRNEWK